MARFAMPVPSREDVRLGILNILAAVLAFSTVNALVKWLVATYPVGEVVFFRGLFAMVPALILLAHHGRISALRTQRLPEHVGRGFVQFLSTICIFTAFGMMPLADAVAITFSNPLFITLLSIPLLGEKVGPHRWAAVIAGFVGILVIVRPGGGVFELGAIFALLNAALGASVTTALRRMSLTEANVTLIFYQSFTACVLGFALLPFGWVTPASWTDLSLLVLVGLCSGAGQYFWTQGYRLAPATVAAPFSYTSMLWALLFGFWVWGEVPSIAVIFGAAIVISAGFYILWRETVRGRDVVRQPQH